MDGSYVGISVGLLSVHLVTRVFSGPSKTMNSTQFHALFLYINSLWELVAKGTNGKH